MPRTLRTRVFRPGPIVLAIRVDRDPDAVSLEHARDEAGPAVDLDTRAAEPHEDFDTGPIDEADPRQIETHRATGPEKIEALALEHVGPLSGNAPFEPQPRLGSRSLRACDPQRHFGLLVTPTTSGA